jgi:hypothetical protein
MNKEQKRLLKEAVKRFRGAHGAAGELLRACDVRGSQDSAALHGARNEEWQPLSNPPSSRSRLRSQTPPK